MESLTQQQYSIEKLNKSHQRQSFSCGIESLDTYIYKQAMQDERRYIAVSYVLNDHESNKMIGYYTLSSSTIEITDLPDEVAKKLPHYPLCPATLIGRLAIDKQYQRTGFGEILLIDALKRAYRNSQEIASLAVIVDAINAQAKNFYKKYGFISLASQKKDKLYLPMQVIEKL